MAVDSVAVVQALGRLDVERLRRYRENLAFFEGRQWAGQARRRERRLVFNYTRAVIEKAAAFTLRGVKSVIADVDGAEEPPALRALRRVYEDNDVGGLDFDSEVDCSVLGDGAFRVVWDVDAKRVRVTAPDVQGLYVWTWPGDPSRAWRVAQRYEVGDEQLALLRGGGPAASAVVDEQPAAVTAGVGGRRQRHRVVELWTAETFEMFVDGRRAEAKPNPYGFLPYVVYPNVRVPKSVWGRSDVEPVRESQRELNRAFSQLSMIMELSGSPIAVLENVRDSADIAVEPGAVWEIPEAAKAYLLDLLQGGGVQLHRDYVELLYRTAHDLAESPRVSFGEADSALSGIAMELQLDPLVKKVERKRRIREVAFRKRDELVLRLLTQFGGQDYAPFETRVVFGALLPTDRAREVRDEVSMVGVGVHSRRTAARNLGSDDAEAEFVQWLQEQRQVKEVGGGPGERVDSARGAGGGDGAAD
ncbi:MAG TPA: phage portal protein [Dehalococcoidia bacterium]